MPKPSYDLWLCQKRQLLEEHSGIVIIRAAEAYGANFLIETFSGSAMPLVWVEFTEQDKDDDIDY